MRRFFVILSVFFAVFGIIFASLPLGTIAFLPIGLTILFASLTLFVSKPDQKKLPKWILFIALLTLLTVMGKVVFIQDKVETDKQFEQQKIESKKENQKDLEGL
jgi:predicted membrane channel-forming protein YqfA (hemolysin III family)